MMNIIIYYNINYTIFTWDSAPHSISW